MNQNFKQSWSHRLQVVIISVPLVALTVLTGIFVLAPTGWAWLLPAAGVVLIISVAALTIFVLRPLKTIMEVVVAMLNHNQELIRQSQEQAQTLEEIYAAIEQVNSSIHQTSQNSGLADQLSQSTLEAVRNGERLGQDTLDAMAQISSSSKQIKEISRFVHDIASQTNLLAINAAVEAARGGENAKGFAIVAAEIKNLAKRSTESSSEIERLINDNLDRVEKGNVVVRQSGEVLQRIVANTEQTSGVVADVAVAMTEQAAALQQIEAAVNQLNQLTQANASVSSAGNLAEQRINQLGIIHQISLSNS